MNIVMFNLHALISRFNLLTLLVFPPFFLLPDYKLFHNGKECYELRNTPPALSMSKFVLTNCQRFLMFSYLSCNT